MSYKEVELQNKKKVKDSYKNKEEKKSRKNKISNKKKNKNNDNNYNNNNNNINSIQPISNLKDEFNKKFNFKQFINTPCSFLEYGNYPIDQKPYYCQVCDPNKTEPICVSCLSMCHSSCGNQQSDINYDEIKDLNFICSCGKNKHDIKISNNKIDSNTSKTCHLFEIDYLLNNKIVYSCVQCKKKSLCYLCFTTCHSMCKKKTKTHLSNINNNNNNIYFEDNYHDNVILKNYYKDENLNYKKSEIDYFIKDNTGCKCNSPAHYNALLLNSIIQELTSPSKFYYESISFIWQSQIINTMLSSENIITSVYSPMINMFQSNKNNNYNIDTLIMNMIIILTKNISSCIIYYYYHPRASILLPFDSILDILENTDCNKIVENGSFISSLMYYAMNVHLKQDFQKYKVISVEDYFVSSPLQRILLRETILKYSLYSKNLHDKYFNKYYCEYSNNIDKNSDYNSKNNKSTIKSNNKNNKDLFKLEFKNSIYVNYDCYHSMFSFNKLSLIILNIMSKAFLLYEDKLLFIKIFFVGIKTITLILKLNTYSINELIEIIEVLDEYYYNFHLFMNSIFERHNQRTLKKPEENIAIIYKKVMYMSKILFLIAVNYNDIVLQNNFHYKIVLKDQLEFNCNLKSSEKNDLKYIINNCSNANYIHISSRYGIKLFKMVINIPISFSNFITKIKTIKELDEYKTLFKISTNLLSLFCITDNMYYNKINTEINQNLLVDNIDLYNKSNLIYELEYKNTKKVYNYNSLSIEELINTCVKKLSSHSYNYYELLTMEEDDLNESDINYDVENECINNELDSNEEVKINDKIKLYITNKNRKKQKEKIDSDEETINLLKLPHDNYINYNVLIIDNFNSNKLNSNFIYVFRKVIYNLLVVAEKGLELFFLNKINLFHLNCLFLQIFINLKNNKFTENICVVINNSNNKNYNNITYTSIDNINDNINNNNNNYVFKNKINYFVFEIIESIQFIFVKNTNFLYNIKHFTHELILSNIDNTISKFLMVDFKDNNYMPLILDYIFSFFKLYFLSKEGISYFILGRTIRRIIKLFPSFPHKTIDFLYTFSKCINLFGTDISNHKRIGTIVDAIIDYLNSFKINTNSDKLQFCKVFKQASAIFINLKDYFDFDTYKSKKNKFFILIINKKNLLEDIDFSNLFNSHIIDSHLNIKHKNNNYFDKLNVYNNNKDIKSNNINEFMNKNNNNFIIDLLNEDNNIDDKNNNKSETNSINKNIKEDETNDNIDIKDLNLDDDNNFNNNITKNNKTNSKILNTDKNKNITFKKKYSISFFNNSILATNYDLNKKNFYFMKSLNKNKEIFSSFDENYNSWKKFLSNKKYVDKNSLLFKCLTLKKNDLMLSNNNQEDINDNNKQISKEYEIIILNNFIKKYIEQYGYYYNANIHYIKQKSIRLLDANMPIDKSSNFLLSEDDIINCISYNIQNEDKNNKENNNLKTKKNVNKNNIYFHIEHSNFNYNDVDFAAIIDLVEISKYTNLFVLSTNQRFYLDFLNLLTKDVYFNIMKDEMFNTLLNIIDISQFQYILSKDLLSLKDRTILLNSLKVLFLIDIVDPDTFSEQRRYPDNYLYILIKNTNKKFHKKKTDTNKFLVELFDLMKDGLALFVNELKYIYCLIYFNQDKISEVIEYIDNLITTIKLIGDTILLDKLPYSINLVFYELTKEFILTSSTLANLYNYIVKNNKVKGFECSNLMNILNNSYNSNSKLLLSNNNRNDNSKLKLLYMENVNFDIFNNKLIYALFCDTITEFFQLTNLYENSNFKCNIKEYENNYDLNFKSVSLITNKWNFYIPNTIQKKVMLLNNNKNNNKSIDNKLIKSEKTIILKNINYNHSQLDKYSIINKQDLNNQNINLTNSSKENKSLKKSFQTTSDDFLTSLNKIYINEIKNVYISTFLNIHNTSFIESFDISNHDLLINYSKIFISYCIKSLILLDDLKEPNYYLLVVVLAKTINFNEQFKSYTIELILEENNQELLFRLINRIQVNINIYLLLTKQNMLFSKVLKNKTNQIKNMLILLGQLIKDESSKLTNLLFDIFDLKEKTIKEYVVNETNINNESCFNNNVLSPPISPNISINKINNKNVNLGVLDSIVKKNKFKYNNQASITNNNTSILKNNSKNIVNNNNVNKALNFSPSPRIDDKVINTKITNLKSLEESQKQLMLSNKQINACMVLNECNNYDDFEDNKENKVIIDILVECFLKLLKKFNIKNYFNAELPTDNIVTLIICLIIFFSELIEGTNEETTLKFNNKIKESYNYLKDIIFYKPDYSYQELDNILLYNLNYRLNINKIMQFVSMDFITSIIEGGSCNSFLVDILNVFKPLDIFEELIFNFKDFLIKLKSKNIIYFTQLSNINEVNCLIELYRYNNTFSKTLEIKLCFKYYNYLLILKDIYTNSTVINFFDNIYQHINSSNKNYYYYYILFLSKLFLKIEVCLKETEARDYQFFLIPAVCLQLSEQTKYKFLDTVDRESTYTKILSLLNATDYFMYEMFSNDNLIKRINSFLRFVLKLKIFYFELFNYFIIIVNQIILIVRFSTSKEYSSQEKHSVYYPNFGICVFQILYLLIVFKFWHISNFNNVFHRNLMIKFNKNFLFHGNKDFTKRLNQYLMVYNSLDKHMEDFLKDIPFSSYFNVLVFDTLLLNNDLFYLILTLILNVLYIIFGNSLLLVVQVVFIVNLSIILKGIVLAVKMKYFQLISVLTFSYLIVYVFSYIAFYYLNKSMFFEELLGFSSKTGAPETIPKEYFCDNSLYCYLSHLSYGVRSGGGIGDVLVKISYKSSPGYYIGRAVYDIFFHICIVWIMGNIFFGIIVDTFADLRDKNTIRINDINNVCYICQIDRDTCVTKNINFDNHVNNDHYVWNYVYFLTYLHLNDPSKFKKIQKVVWEKLISKDTSWFPNE